MAGRTAERELGHVAKIGGGVPFRGGDCTVGEQPVESGQHAPGLAEIAIVDTRRLNPVVMAIERGRRGASMLRCRRHQLR
jgi:hypothetical protein